MSGSNGAGSVEGVRVLRPGYEAILSAPALAFVADLTRRFRPRVHELLEARRQRQARIDAGERPDFLPATAELRASDWTVSPVPPDLRDRRVEITGPVDRKMIINALSSGANAFMADFEDATAPTWDNLLSGQVNLFDAVRGTIQFTSPDGRVYALGTRPATLFVRPRGWHLEERHVLVDGSAATGALFDFGLYFFHNARARLERGVGSYFYLPKLESHLEARLWNDVFVHAQRALGIPEGTIRATVLIETLPAAFEMDEILHELRAHSAGLNCGRWDYIFSFIKTFCRDPAFVLPDRAQVSMDKAFLSAYSRLLIETCHRRGVHAMGGMAAQIPIKDDPAASEAALAKVRADKLREVTNGHDGTWVAHPGLVALAREVFDEHMPGPNQIERRRSERISREDLLRVPDGTRTVGALRHNIRVGIQYIEAWLRGQGCVPLYHLMEDAATAEISRAQIWQWREHGAILDDGQPVSDERIEQVTREELATIRRELGDARFVNGRFAQAEALFLDLATRTPFADFLTLPAYDRLLADEGHP